MYRNLNTRVEAAAPVEARPLRQRLWGLLQTALEDRRQVWEMQPDGSYRQRDPAGLPPDDPRGTGTHQRLMAAAFETARARAAE
jgi:polyphosphate kinase